MAKEINETKPKRKRSSFPFAEVSLLAITIISLAFGGFFFYKYQQVNDKYTELTMTNEEKTRRAIDQVAAVYDVPKYEDEQPTVPGTGATGFYKVVKEEIESIKKASSFFADATEGDILLAYKNANVAILFRPSENKIVKLGSFAEASLIKVNVGLIAGSEIAKTLESQLNQKFPNQIVVTVKNPSTNTVATGVVVDVSGTEAAATKQIADALGYQIGSLPNGETAPPDAKIVIIAPNAVTQP